ncbi:unnamed protein product, partial [Ectocarpus sp. 4 AP-2014]
SGLCCLRPLVGVLPELVLERRVCYGGAWKVCLKVSAKWCRNLKNFVPATHTQCSVLWRTRGQSVQPLRYAKHENAAPPPTQCEVNSLMTTACTTMSTPPPPTQSLHRSPAAVVFRLPHLASSIPRHSLAR